jgi:hypothetical protein
MAIVQPEGLGQFKKSTSSGLEPATFGLQHSALTTTLPRAPIQDMIKSNINKYKNHTSVNENQLIKDLFTQTIEERRLKRIWPEDLLDEA